MSERKRMPPAGIEPADFMLLVGKHYLFAVVVMSPAVTATAAARGAPAIPTGLTPVAAAV